MPSITFETGVLSIPQNRNDRNGAISYVERLLDWSEALTESWLSVFMSGRTTELLFDEGLYSYDLVRTLLSLAGVVEYDANTVNRVVMTLLQTTPSFEEAFQIEDVLADKVSTVRDILSEKSPPSVAEDLERILTMTCLLRNHCRRPEMDHAIIVEGFSGHEQIQLRARMHDLQTNRTDLHVSAPFPTVIEGPVWVCGGFHDLLISLDETRLFQKFETASVDLAIKVAIFKSRTARGSPVEWSGLTTFRMGTRFLDTLRARLGTQPSGTIKKCLRACVETIEGVSLADVHALRVDQGANAVQLLRGTDKAWRRDIDRDLHLHFWECQDCHELAVVVPTTTLQFQSESRTPTVGQSQQSEWSLGLIGSVSAAKCRGKAVRGSRGDFDKQTRRKPLVVAADAVCYGI